MDKDIITKISSVETKLENSLKAEDFISVSSLSVELDQLVKELTEAAKVEKFSDIENQELEQLLLKLNNFKKQTVERFKNYTSKVSQQTKMHRAYKQ